MNGGRQCRSRLQGRKLLGFPPEACLGHHAAARLGTGTRPAALLDPATPADAQTRPAFRVLHSGWGCRSCSRLGLLDSHEVASLVGNRGFAGGNFGPRRFGTVRRYGAVKRCSDTGVQVPFHRGVDKRGTPLSNFAQWRTFCESTSGLPPPPCGRVDRSSYRGRPHAPLAVTDSRQTGKTILVR